MKFCLRNLKLFWLICSILINISKCDNENDDVNSDEIAESTKTIAAKDLMRLESKISFVSNSLSQIEQKLNPLLKKFETENDNTGNLEKLINDNAEKTKENWKEIQLLKEILNNIQNNKSSPQIQDCSSLCHPIREEVLELKETIANLTEWKNQVKKLIKAPCDSNPCLWGGECVVTSDGKDYECTGCPPLTAGKNCQDLKSPETSFRLNTTVYVMYPEVSVTWSEARAKCQSEGMVMAMLKDRPAHHFVRNALLAKYQNEPARQDAFWFGLRRDTLQSRWKWVDGSDLSGEYEGWAFKPVHEDLCGNIANTQSFQFNWDADKCEGYPDWNYYALCQKDLVADDVTPTLKVSPCESKPCLFGGECVVTSYGSDYECTGCPPLTAGKNCEELSCEDAECFRLENVVYVIYRNESVTWFEARTKCQMEGLRMAMFKKKAAHLFVRDHLKALYAREKEKQDAFWFGLRRVTLFSPWMWADGHYLAGYEGWAFKPVHSDLCANVANTRAFDFKWDADRCDRAHGWTYYALCEKDISPPDDDYEE